MAYFIRRVSEVVPLPTIGSDGLPQAGWAPSSVTDVDWGSVRVVMSGQDVSSVRGVPYSAVRYSLQSPFGCGPASVTMPGLWHWDTLGYGSLTWCRVGADVDLVHVSPALATVKVLWSGQIGDYAFNSDGSVTFVLVGDLWSANFQHVHQYRRIPVTDIGKLIPDTLNAVISRRYNRSGSVATVTTGLTTRRRAGTGQGVIEYVQEILATAGTLADASDAWTVERVAGSPRTYEVRRRGAVTTTWTYTVGQRGLVLDLTASGTTLPNAIYASGQDDKGQAWSGLRFPLGPGNILSTTRLPIAYAEAVRPRLWDFTTGADTGANSLYDPVVMRIEADYALGTGVSRADAYATLRPAFARQASIGIAGTITATLDPQEGSRFDVREGDLIRVQGLQGYAHKDLRVAQVDASVPAADDPTGAVRFTVDELGRDLVQVVAALRNDEESRNDPARLPMRAARSAALKRDRTIPFDAESLAGYVKVAVPANTWTRIDVPVSEVGTTAVVDLATSPACAFVWAAFGDTGDGTAGNPGVQASDLVSLVGNPLTPRTDGRGPFDAQADALETLGLMQAAGAPGQACGYSRSGSTGDGYQTSPYDGTTTTLTGRFYSTASWSYRLSQPPFMRLFFWCTAATTVTGRLVPAPAEV